MSKWIIKFRDKQGKERTCDIEEASNTFDAIKKARKKCPGLIKPLLTKKIK